MLSDSVAWGLIVNKGSKKLKLGPHQKLAARNMISIFVLIPPGGKVSVHEDSSD